MDADVSTMTEDQLASGLTTWAGRLAAGEARFIELLGEFDERSGWVGHGVLSCAHWVSWKLGMSRSTARDKVRVARLLRSLPGVAERFREGRLSYAQVRALTRVATASDEQRWLDLAEQATADQLERAARGVRRSLVADERAADPGASAEAALNEVTTRWDEDGALVVTLRIAPKDAVAVMARLDEETAAVQAERDTQLAALAAAAAAASAEAAMPADPFAGKVWRDLVAAFPQGVPVEYRYVEPPYPFSFDGGPQPGQEQKILLEQAYRAAVAAERGRRDAWRAWQEHLAREALGADLPIGRATRADGFIRALTRRADGTSMVKVSLLVDPISGWARVAGEELMPPQVVRSIIDGSANRPVLPRIRPITADDLLRHDQGRANRLVSPALRALLGRLDGERCRMPSCSRRRKLHAHHVVYWRDGGRTDLGILILVCSRHHTLIHQYGWRVTLHEDRSLAVTTGDGQPLPHRHPLPAGKAEELDPDHRITATTLPTRWQGGRMDLHHVVWVLRQHAA